MSLVDFICVCPSPAHHSPILLREKVACEDHGNVIQSETVKLGNVSELFNESEGISSLRFQFLCYLREITY